MHLKTLIVIVTLITGSHITSARNSTQNKTTKDEMQAINETSQTLDMQEHVSESHSRKGDGVNQGDGLTRKLNNYALCGKPTMTKLLGARIVNGTAADKGQWPWQVMILSYSTQYHFFYQSCGGTLINEQWVLTAAHCFSGSPASFTQIALGANFLNLTEPSVKLITAGSINCHKFYVGSVNSYADDICLVKLPSKVSLTDYIIPACLPLNNTDVSDGKTCVITGWGETKGTGSNSVLREASVKIIPKNLCTTWYGQSSVTLPSNHFCAGYAYNLHRGPPNYGPLFIRYSEGLIDSCQGDSGGPLVCQPNTSASYTLKGITSFGKDCALPELPGVYTNVVRYLDWIEETLSNNEGPDQCYSTSHLSCNTVVYRNKTVIRTPIVDEESWIYPPNTDCYWDIEAPEGAQILLEFLCILHLESSDANRCYDYLNITSTGADISLIHCEPGIANPYTINSNKAMIEFHSDSTVQAAGFVIKINFIGDPQTSTLVNRVSTSAGNEVRPSLVIFSCTSIYAIFIFLKQ